MADPIQYEQTCRYCRKTVVALSTDPKPDDHDSGMGCELPQCRLDHIEYCKEMQSHSLDNAVGHALLDRSRTDFYLGEIEREERAKLEGKEPADP